LEWLTYNRYVYYIQLLIAITIVDLRPSYWWTRIFDENNCKKNFNFRYYTSWDCYKMLTGNKSYRHSWGWAPSTAVGLPHNDRWWISQFWINIIVTIEPYPVLYHFRIHGLWLKIFILSKILEFNTGTYDCTTKKKLIQNIVMCTQLH